MIETKTQTKPNMFESIATEGFAKFPEFHDRGTLGLMCPGCTKGVFVGVTPRTDFDNLFSSWIPWTKCKCECDIELSFHGPGIWGFLPEFFRVDNVSN